MEKFTTEQRTKIVKFYYQNQGSIVLTQRTYRRHYGVKDSPSESMIRRLIGRFEAQGSVSDLPRTGRPRSVRNEATVKRVRESFEEDPSISTRIRSGQVGVCRTSLRRILKTMNLIPYKIYSMRKNITISSKNEQGDCPGVLAGDAAKTKRGLIVLQEWWGMNQQIQDEAADLSSRGPFVTLVPDLYRGKLATDNEEAGHLMSNLDWDGAIQDIEGAAKYLLNLGCKKVGVTGFCMGGALSFAAAVRVSEISASAPFYGIPGDSIADVTKIKIPLQCHFGKTDHVAGFSSPVEQEALRKKLDGAKIKHEFHAYDAGHAFINVTSPGYHKESCDLALDRLIKFMNDNL